MARQRQRTDAIYKRRVASVGYGVGYNLGQTIHTSVLGGDVVAHKKESGVESTVAWKKRHPALLAHRYGKVEAHHIVFAVESGVYHTSRLGLHTCPTTHQLGVVEPRTEANKSHTRREHRYAIAVEAAVAVVERRHNAAVYQHLVVDKGR